MKAFESFLCALGILALSVVGIQAQSGRRAGGSSTTTSTTTPSVSGPKAIDKKAEKSATVQLLVGIEDLDAFSNIPYYLTDTVLDNCIRRLGDAADVSATSAGRGINRGDALKRAKEEKNRYFVLLAVGSDAPVTSKQSKNGPDELYVSYTVFEPETAKVKASGRAHHSIYRAGRVGVSGPTKNSPLYSEYALKQAARETADRILSAFDLKVPDDRMLQSRGQ